MKFYIYKNNQQNGPFDELTIEGKLRDGTYSFQDLACRQGEQQWHPLSFFFPENLNSPHSWMKDSGNLPPNQAETAYHQQYQPQFQQHQTANPPARQQSFNQSTPPQSVQHVVYHHAFEPEPESGLPTVSMVIGIVCASLMLIGLVPCLGWINWFVLMLGGVNKLLSIVAIIITRNPAGRNKAIIGLVLTLVALVIGVVRLALGGGIC